MDEDPYHKTNHNRGNRLGEVLKYLKMSQADFSDSKECKKFERKHGKLTTRYGPPDDKGSVQLFFGYAKTSEKAYPKVSDKYHKLAAEFEKRSNDYRKKAFAIMAEYFLWWWT